MRSSTTVTWAQARTTSATFPGELQAVSRMRDVLRPILDSYPEADEVILCASELAGNAVMHSDSRRLGGTFTVHTQIRGNDYVLIEVTDNGGPWHEQINPTGGRGLMIVSALASDWGIRTGSGTRTVWAIFTWPSGDHAL